MLDQNLDKKSREFLEHLRNEALIKRNDLGYQASHFESLKSLIPSQLSFDQDWITIGSAIDIKDERHRKLLEDTLSQLAPWKKGPFSIFGYPIDSEWQSHLKWNRITPHCSSLENKIVGDLGCHNGYFMYRMLELKPKMVVGFEPYVKNWHTFDFLQTFSKNRNLFFEPYGVEHINHFNNFFDTIFCLGLLYHLTDPIEALKKIHSSLKPKGEIYIDCQGIPGNESLCLFPTKRYANAKGVWFLPTLNALIHWLKRTNFIKIHCFYKAPLSTLEQRSTKWAPIDSLDKFLDQKNSDLTVEGYPAPWRFYLRATKG